MSPKKLALSLFLPLVLVAGACSDGEDSADDVPTDEETTTEDSAPDEGDGAASEDSGTEAAEAETVAMSPGNAMGTPPTGDTAELNIAEIAAGTADVSTLTRLVIKGGLLPTVRDGGPFTVFAPTNEAFAEIPHDVLRDLSANQPELADVLTLHVLAGEYTAEDLASLDGSTVDTVQGGKLAVSVEGDVITVGGATVIAPDVFASNGVVHLVDTVITQP
ncbi:MAG: fasciclin domain-containing protein, partial [Microthrixaceae bacterium]|nr:fasciclin domain-containing protein [Microthrixaceae bacterium]